MSDPVLWMRLCLPAYTLLYPSCTTVLASWPASDSPPWLFNAYFQFKLEQTLTEVWFDLSITTTFERHCPSYWRNSVSGLPAWGGTGSLWQDSIVDLFRIYGFGFKLGRFLKVTFWTLGLWFRDWCPLTQRSVVFDFWTQVYTGRTQGQRFTNRGFQKIGFICVSARS